MTFNTESNSITMNPKEPGNYLLLFRLEDGSKETKDYSIMIKITKKEDEEIEEPINESQDELQKVEETKKLDD